MKLCKTVQTVIVARTKAKRATSDACNVPTMTKTYDEKWKKSKTNWWYNHLCLTIIMIVCECNRKPLPLHHSAPNQVTVSSRSAEQRMNVRTFICFLLWPFLLSTHFDSDDCLSHSNSEAISSCSSYNVTRQGIKYFHYRLPLNKRLLFIPNVNDEHTEWTQSCIPCIIIYFNFCAIHSIRVVVNGGSVSRKNPHPHTRIVVTETIDNVCHSVMVELT